MKGNLLKEYCNSLISARCCSCTKPLLPLDSWTRPKNLCEPFSLWSSQGKQRHLQKAYQCAFTIFITFFSKLNMQNSGAFFFNWQISKASFSCLNKSSIPEGSWVRGRAQPRPSSRRLLLSGVATTLTSGLGEKCYFCFPRNQTCLKWECKVGRSWQLASRLHKV